MGLVDSRSSQIDPQFQTHNINRSLTSFIVRYIDHQGSNIYDYVWFCVVAHPAELNSCFKILYFAHSSEYAKRIELTHLWTNFSYEVEVEVEKEGPWPRGVFGYVGGVSESVEMVSVAESGNMYSFLLLAYRRACRIVSLGEEHFIREITDAQNFSDGN